MQNSHLEALAKILRLGVDMRTVLRNQLDDPRISEDERAERVRIYLDKRDFKNRGVLPTVEGVDESGGY
jgi:hypothetical protein